jgi:hypothetical protein
VLSSLLVLANLSYTILDTHKHTVSTTPNIKSKDSLLRTTPNIVGVWKHEEDENWQLKFLSNDTCINTYVGSMSDTCTYSISNTSPQCGTSVPVTSRSSYLQLINILNSGDNLCYDINGITDSILSITPVENHNIFVFKRQMP